MSKIEQIINEIEEYIDGCRFQPLSNTKITVNKDELDDYLEDLKQSIPDEVKKYQRIIANRDAILKDAQDKADEMLRKANEMTSTLVSEHEIMQQAFREANIVIEEATAKANDIVQNATAEANELRSSAIQYTDDALGNIQNILNTAIEGMTVKYDGVMRSLQSSLEVTTKDRQSLKEFTDNNQRVVEEEHYDYSDTFANQTQMPQAGDSFVENSFEPAASDDSAQYDAMTVQDAEGADTNVNAADEIHDFNLNFDEFK